MSEEKTEAQKYLDAVKATADQQNKILSEDLVFDFAKKMAAVGICKLTVGELTIELNPNLFYAP